MCLSRFNEKLLFISTIIQPVGLAAKHLLRQQPNQIPEGLYTAAAKFIWSSNGILQVSPPHVENWNTLKLVYLFFHGALNHFAFRYVLFNFLAFPYLSRTTAAICGSLWLTASISHTVKILWVSRAQSSSSPSTSLQFKHATVVSHFIYIITSAFVRNGHQFTISLASQWLESWKHRRYMLARRRLVRLGWVQWKT